MGVTLGAGFGPSSMGSRSEHHLATAVLHVGKRLNSGQPALHNVEVGAELWGGGQFNPEAACLAGVTPMLRYHFLRDARWGPFMDAGAGVTFTDIGLPDLSTALQFNLQLGTGFHWKLRENLAVTFLLRYLHISNASIEAPNHGVNCFLLSGGLPRFF